ncbi:MAG: CvpA family protein [Clostridia bacterium]|nr:CvpA family protein [Clostridia bacterium]
MNIFAIVIICCIVAFAALGAGIGVIKGFTNVKSWGVELILIGLIGIPVAKLITKKLSGVLPAILTIGITVLLVVLFMALFILLRKLLKRAIEKRKELWSYKHYDEQTDEEEKILTAAATDNKKEYKKLTKHRLKSKGGVFTVLDRTFGGITLAIKGAVLTAIFAAAILTVLNLTRLTTENGVMYGAMGSMYATGAWKFFSDYIFDFLAIGIIMLCVRSGYSSGVSSAVWTLVVILLVVGAAVVSWQMAFKVDEFGTVAEGLAAKLEKPLGSISSVLSKLNITTLKMAKIILAAIIFLLILVFVILIAIFVPKLIDRAREGTVFSIIDGVLGAIFMTITILALLLAVGAVANSMHDLAFMNVFNEYFDKSGIATYFYDRNLFNAMGILKLPISSWVNAG